jgi:polysaccharide biosynthesis protein PslG
MSGSRRRARPARLGFFLLAGLILGGVFLARSQIRSALFALTGEERLFSQVKGLTDLSADFLRPRTHLEPNAAVRYTDLNPYGVNVFVNEEADPAKREASVRLAAEAGFHWLRQEFPWQDIEIHAKGDFQDRRNQPYRSAWDKYDQIVDLADKYGMELIVRISTPPSWSRKAGDNVGTFAPPDHYEDFGDFVYALVSRYRGRIRYYQIWNEPNIYPEWGRYSISPEDYTRLLEIAATRAREADPNVVIISGALASTIAMQPDAQPPNNALNDLLFLQRMYDAGAAPYFDVMAMQAYGLWSGPTDRRMHPRVMNFGRPQFVRDLMVANGDAQKPIWISEMGWNAAPDSLPDKRFGQASLEQQARFTPIAYQRVQEEWPWAGVVNTWYLKRATDEWFKQGRPEAYFRLVDPDFTLQPVFNSLKTAITGDIATVYQGSHSPLHWAIQATGPWETIKTPGAPFGQVRQNSQPGARLSFRFDGTDLGLMPACSPGVACTGKIRVSIDDLPPVEIGATQAAPSEDGGLAVASGLENGPHRAVIEVLEAPAGLAAIVVSRRGFRLPWPVLGALGAALVVLLLIVFTVRRLGARRRAARAGGGTYTPPKVFPRPKPERTSDGGL